MTLKFQQLRRREPLNPEPPVAGDPDGPLTKEPVGRRLHLGERFLSGTRDGEALGERVHHLSARERARLLGQSRRSGQGAERRLQLGAGGRPAALTPADLSEVPLIHPLLASSRAHRAYTLCSLSEWSFGWRVATAAALDALIPLKPCSASQWSISSERLENRSISRRSSSRRSRPP